MRQVNVKRISPSSVKVSGRCRKDMGDIDDLMSSIDAVGLLQPIVVTSEMRLVAGERRLRAWKKLYGATPIPAHVADTLGDALLLIQAERDENVCRKDFLPSEAVAVGEKLRALEEKEAKRRQLAGAAKGSTIGGQTAGRGRPKETAHGETFPKGKRDETQRTRAKIASNVGMSDRTYEKAKAVIDSGDAEVIKLMDTTGKVERAHRELKRKKQHANLEAIAAQPAKAVDGKFDVIVCDPPWAMEKIERDCRPNQAEMDYPTLSQSELLALDIPAAADCHLWLWTTHRFIRDGFELLDAWGFKYVCTFVWHKGGGFQPVGLPQFNCEFALYGRRGRPTFKDTKSLFTCFESPRGKHSEKPEAFFDTVRRVTSGRRLDMFSRRQIDGFVGWGNEAVG